MKPETAVAWTERLCLTGVALALALAALLTIDQCYPRYAYAVETFWLGDGYEAAVTRSDGAQSVAFDADDIKAIDLALSGAFK